MWVEWAREQSDPKPSWLLPWEELDDGQREVDMRIGEALFHANRALAIAHTPAPLENAEDAHRRRDFFGLVEAARAGQQSLESQPWYPARHGDVVLIHYEGVSDVPASGETYIVEQPDADGWYNLRLLAHTQSESMGQVGAFATEGDPDPLMEMWFEAGPHRLAIVRDGRVVHNGDGAMSP
ncbi:hypothetical protein [Nonomuraea rubra]|uniref:hypothetical protein n=1 Tax=Nonomuraea rubra TaxID=46180 RepID=UPI0033C834B2